MAIIINDNLAVNAGKPVDSKYLNITIPWTGTTQVNAAIPLSYRYIGLVVNINNSEFWYRTGTTNSDLVAKAFGTVGAATNGIHLVSGDTTVSLGGVLMENSIFYEGTGHYTLRYGADYSAYYDQRSLVDKGYVDGIASGLKPKQAVLVATDSSITLSGLTTVDGVLLTTGDRVLVKNPINDVNNGVYSASTGTWGRTNDFDGSPSSEVISGSYMWVLSGNTNANTAWVLDTPDPITVGVTPLNFVLFSTVSDVTAGTGIIVTSTGSTHVVSFDGANVRGDGLSWNGSKLSITGGTVNGVTGATNGITRTPNNLVVLGGTLTGNTLIALPYPSTPTAFIVSDTAGSDWHGGRIGVAFGAVNTGHTAFIGSRHTSACYSEIKTYATTGITLSACYGGTYHGLRLGSNALTYDACYHADYTNRTLVDKEYVDNAGSTISAYNGLTKVGNAIGLGGELSGNTVISGGTRSLNFGHASSLLNNFRVCSVSALICTNGNVGLSTSSGVASLCSSIGSSGVTITSPSTGAVYTADYSSTFVSNSLVTKRYVDSRNNIVNVNNITGATYAVTTLDSFIGVSGTSMIYLPVSPSFGQKVIISDICGNALNNGICIDGQGKRINDSTCTFASINTNYGSVTFIYNGIFWSASAFVN